MRLLILNEIMEKFNDIQIEAMNYQSQHEGDITLGGKVIKTEKDYIVRFLECNNFTQDEALAYYENNMDKETMYKFLAMYFMIFIDNFRNIEELETIIKQTQWDIQDFNTEDLENIVRYSIIYA